MAEFYTVREVAGIFRLKREQTVREWIRRGHFPNAIKLDGYLIPHRDVENFIAVCKTKGVVKL